MHMILRTLIMFLKRPFLKPSAFSDTTIISMRVLPTDLDILMHVNNGVYFSFMDFGRWDMTFRNGIFQKVKEQGWYAVVAGETIKFKKSLELWDKFNLETQTLGHDDKYFFIRQRFISKGDLMATGLVKVRFLKRKGGTVSPAEIITLFKDQELQNHAPNLGDEWYELESRYLT